MKHFSPSGASVHDLSSISSGSAEIVSQAAADTGIYEVRVKAYGTGGDFGLLVRVEDPASTRDLERSIQPRDHGAGGITAMVPNGIGASWLPVRRLVVVGSTW